MLSRQYHIFWVLLHFSTSDITFYVSYLLLSNIPPQNKFLKTTIISVHDSVNRSSDLSSRRSNKTVRSFFWSNLGLSVWLYQLVLWLTGLGKLRWDNLYNSIPDLVSSYSRLSLTLNVKGEESLSTRRYSLSHKQFCSLHLNHICY